MEEAGNPVTTASVPHRYGGQLPTERFRWHRMVYWNGVMQVELEHLRQELRKLPPDLAVQLLRELVDQVPIPAPDQGAWDRASDEVIDRYREALERLAK